MTTKTVMSYTVFGVSFYKDAHRLRFSNDLAGRIKQFKALGDTDINLVELPHAMNKLEAVQWAKTSGSFDKEHEQKLIDAFIEKNTKVESAEPKKRGRKPKAVVEAAPTLEGADETAEQSTDEAAEASDDDLLAALMQVQDEKTDEQLEADVA